MARFNDDEIGGRETGAWRLVPSQRTRIEDALKYEKIATKILGDFKQQLQLGGEVSGKSKIVSLVDGTRIFVVASMLGLAHADEIHIDMPSSDSPSQGVTVYGYVILSNFTVYSILPGGRQSGHGAKDNPSETEVRELYVNNPAFDFVGYPDFGGAKRIPFAANDVDGGGGGYASNEFESLWYHDEIDSKHAVEPPPPPGLTWPDVYHDWEPRDTPRDTSSEPFYFQNWRPGNIGAVSKRIDGQGLWFRAPFQWTTSGIIFLENEIPQYPDAFNPDGYDVFIMLPIANFRVEYSSEAIDSDAAYWVDGWSNSFTEFEVKADVVNYPEEWLPDTDTDPYFNAWYPWKPNPATSSHHDIIVHKWDVSEVGSISASYAAVTVPITVNHGAHEIMAVGGMADYEIRIYTDTGLITRRITRTPSESEVGIDAKTLTVRVGHSNSIEEAIY